MDDFIVSSLEESKNEWCIRLYSILTPHIIDGLKSLFNEAWNMCVETKEPHKYLMTFQNLLSRIPKWNAVIVEQEKKRIVEKSGCNYLEDLITCVQIIQLKCLTCIRVSNKQKKIDLETLKLDTFIHKVYILVARKIYSKMYLFEVLPKGGLEQQRNQEKLEFYVRECIMNVIRDSIPTEQIIMAYLDETVEEEEEVVVEPIKDPAAAAAPALPRAEPLAAEAPPPPTLPSVKDLNDEPVTTTTTLTFSDYDAVLENDKEIFVKAPKTLERLEEISATRQPLQSTLDSTDDEKITLLEPIDIDLPPSGGAAAAADFQFIDL
jgi:hypothetical protein